MKKLLPLLITLLASAAFVQLNAQTIDVSSCAISLKRSNGNGQASSAPGYFPGYGINNPVATNVVGTKYDTVSYVPSSKTGDIILYWTSVTTITKLPVITRAWITPTGSSVSTLSASYFGPPSPPSVSGQNYNVKYCYYNQNLPPAGTLTLEFANPQTNAPVFFCSYDLQSGASAPNPSFSCAPTITTQPTNQILCGVTSASFSVVANGAVSYQWQVSNDSVSWSNITNGGNYANATTATLSITSPATYSGKYYRVVLTGNTGCGNTNSYAALLLARPKPTALFANAYQCGTGTQSLAVNLTGTAPWSVTYNNGGSAITVNNITSSPYYISASGASTYNITAVSDAYCSNTGLTGITATLAAAPTGTPTSTSVCYGSTSFSLAYSSTGSPNRYSITAGVRAMPGFVAISNATLAASPVSITIPGTVSAGVYDFNLVVNNSTTGCSSTSVPFTVTVKAVPTISAGANTYSICPAATATLSAAGASTYSWSPATGLSATNVASPVFTAGSTTTFTVTGTASNGCTATGTVAITVKTAPTVGFSTSPSASICSGDQVSITASGASSYAWTGPSSYTASGNQIIVSPTTTSTYNVTATGSNGCTATGSQAITVSGGPTLSLTSSSSICKGAIVSLTASGASTYVWSPVTDLYTDAGATVPYTGTSVGTVYAKPNTTTTYTVYGTSGNCTSSKTVTITVSTPTITAPPTQVMYCASDLSGGNNNQINFNFSSSASVTCKWEYNTTNTWPGTEITSTNTNNQYARSEANTTSVTTSTVYIKTPGVGAQYYRLTVTSGSCTLYYYTQLVSLTGTPTFTVSSAQTICSGSTPSSLTADGFTTAGNSSPATTYTYKWQSSTNGTTFTDIASTNSTTYSPGALTQDTWYRWAVVVSSTNCAGTYFSSAVKITVATNITNNTLSLSNACSSGVTVTGSTPAGGNGTSYSYSWESSTTSSSSGFSSVANATSQSYTPPIPSVTTWYRRLVTSGSCANSTSSAIAIYPPITASQISTGQTICTSGSLTALSVTPAGGQTGSSFTYQWKISNNAGVSYSDSTGATSSSLTLPNYIGTRYYQVVITKGSCTVTSNASIITVNGLPTVTVTPSSAAVCQYNSSTLTAGGAVSYTWSPSTDLSASSGSVVISTPTAGRTYTVTGTDANGCTNTANATISFTAAPTDPASLTLADKTICSTAGTYTLSNSNPDGNTYEWFAAPSNTVTVITSASASGTYYAYKKSGSCYSQNYATLNFIITDVSKPTVASTSLTYCSPATADLTALQPAAATGVSYEWHTVSSGPAGGNLVGSPAAVSTGTYYLYAYSSGGSCFGPASNAVAININSGPAASLSSTSASVCYPASVDLTSYNNTAGSNTYNWYSTNSPIAANLVAVPQAITQTGSYYLYATNASGCTGSGSSALTVTVNSKPTASIVSPSAVCGGAAVSITAVSDATGSPVYTWQYSTDGSNWSAVSNGGVYSGAATSILAVSNTSSLNGYYYRYTVTSGASCSNTSDGAIVISETAPAVSTQPLDASTGIGFNTSFSLSVSGNFSSNYQWQVSTNGGTSYADISESATYSGTTTSELAIAYATAGLNNYKYRCVVTNSCNTLTSNAATLSVAACTPPTPSFTSSAASSICMDGAITYTTQASQNEYVWSLTGTQGTDYQITSGSIGNTSNTVSINWLTAGVKTVTVNYKNGTGCAGQSAASSTTIVKTTPAISSQPASSQIIATGNRVVLTVSATNASAFEWSKNSSVVADSTRNAYTIDELTASNGGTFTTRAIAFSGCYTSGSSYVVTPSTTLYSKNSGNLNDPQTWGVSSDGTGSTPLDFTRSEHTFVLANRSTAATAANLTIAGTLDVKDGKCIITAGTTLTAGIITRSGSSGSISGSNTSNLVLTGISNAGTSNLYFDVTGGTNILKDLTVNAGTVNISNTLGIAGGASAGTVTVNGGVLASNGNMHLRSDANGTARIAPPAAGAAYTAGGYITGDVTVERYIPANSNRAWRLMSIPTRGSQTIHEAWQENATAPLNGSWSQYTNPVPGYGTNLTSSMSTAITGAGYDYKTPSNSLLYYDSEADDLFPVSSTSAPIETTAGYFIYIRGDRTMMPSSSLLQVTPTILRTKGTLNQGTQSALTVSAGKYLLAGNPYASRVDLRNIVKSGVDNSLQVWDPKLVGSYTVGAFQTLTLLDGNYIVSPGGGSYGPAGSTVNMLESGQAFYARGSTGGGGGSIQFTEDSKISGSRSSVFRPLQPTQRIVTLLSAVSNGVSQLADGTMNIYDDRFADEVDVDDAMKFENMSENFSISQKSNLLAVDKRKRVSVTDTVYYNMYWLKKMNYQLTVTAAGFDQSNLLAKLEDKFTGTSTMVNMDGSATTINFAVTSAAASSAGDRFKLVLYPSVVLPVTFTAVKATLKHDAVDVEWKVSNQLNTKSYRVAKSTDGVNFTDAFTKPVSSNESAAVYTWKDINPAVGTNYYRITSEDVDGNIKYSSIAKVMYENVKAGISLVSNPVKGNSISLQFVQQAKGTYMIRLTNIAGQLLYQKQINHPSGNAVHSCTIGTFAAGQYQLQITGPNKSMRQTQQLIIQQAQ